MCVCVDHGGLIARQVALHVRPFLNLAPKQNTPWCLCLHFSSIRCRKLTYKEKRMEGWSYESVYIWGKHHHLIGLTFALWDTIVEIHYMLLSARLRNSMGMISWNHLKNCEPLDVVFRQLWNFLGFYTKTEGLMLQVVYPRWQWRERVCVRIGEGVTSHTYA